MRSCVLALVLTAAAAPFHIAAAQHPRGTPPGQPVHIAPAGAAQFDFLIGQWELVVRPKVNSLAARIHGAPRLAGTWKAWRAMDGWGVEDELRIVDASGNPTSLTHALRVFDATQRRWSQMVLDVYRGRFTQGSAALANGAMTVTSRGTDQEGRAYVLRTRFDGITATAFRVQQDRSYDNGETWDEGTLRIDARRTAQAAPR